MDSSNESTNGGEQPPTLSAETVLAVRRYNQQVASYTLRQWNAAKLESERKQRDRRKRRADYLVQQKGQHQSANAVPTVRPSGSLTSAGVHGPRPSSEALCPNTDGPLMIVCRRKADRGLSGGASVPSIVPVQPITRHSHDQHYASRVDQHAQSYDTHADISSVADQRPHPPAAHQQRPRRHQRSSHGSYATELAALHPISPISTASTVIKAFGKPETIHVESVVTGSGPSSSRSLDDRPLTPPRWQRRVSASTPPITIPRPSATAVPAGADSASTSGGSSASRSASPARALGFAAHLGMTSISTGPSTSAMADSMSTSTSTSNPTSEGSSRMSSFSEANGFPGIRHSLVTEQNSPRNMLDVVRPKRSHRTSLNATTAQRGPAAPCAVEGAIGTLRRMTVSGDETGVFGALDHH